MTAERAVNLYDLMDSAYDVPLIDVNPRRNPVLKAEIAAENNRRRLVGHKPRLKLPVITNAVRLNAPTHA
ncbi:hypothetical protein SAMN05421690_101011 [Nitrosomonas sp. Nm51]|nr:hypothetical protein SAMN05421690_101011 [Nitrosomonas sp. Nm51]